MKRRNFLKYMCGATALTLAGCSTKESDSAAASPSPKKSGTMTYRTTPTTGDSVSLLGFGCMRFPTVDNNPDAPLDQESINSLIDYAIEHGVNYFDTSPVYCKGESERATGIALARHPRHKWLIATKMSNFDPETWPRERSIEIFENSLRNLQTDHIDYLLLHAIGGGEDAMATFRARFIDNGILDYLLEQREKGRIRNLGFSYHGDIAVFDHLLANHDRYKWDFVQIQLNYVDWEHAKQINDSNTDAKYLYAELQKRGIPAVIMEPMLGGRLARLSDSLSDRLKARRPDDSLASWAFRFAGTPEGVLTVLSGMNRLEHLQDNLATFSPLEPLDEEEQRLLEEVARRYVDYTLVNCTGCQYCMPCPYGLDIPGIFAQYNKCVNLGDIPDSPDDPRYNTARRRYLVGYDRAVPKMRQADRCVHCGNCSPQCPQSIDIPDRLAYIDGITERLRRGPIS